MPTEEKELDDEDADVLRRRCQLELDIKGAELKRLEERGMKHTGRTDDDAFVECGSICFMAATAPLRITCA